MSDISEEEDSSVEVVSGISSEESEDSDIRVISSEEETEYPATMSVKLNPPLLHKCKNYASYKVELEGWETITDLDKKKRGMFIALSLPNEEEDKDNTGIREKVFEQLNKEDLGKEDGLKTLKEFLDLHLGKDEMSDMLEKFEAFDEYKRDDKQTIQEFITKFDAKYQRLSKLDLKLPSPILAFTLLRRANLTKQEKQLVLTGMDFTKKDTLYTQAKESLKKFLGEHPTGGACAGMMAPVAIKLEPAFLAENEEALIAAGYVHQSKVFGRGTSGTSRSSGQWRGRGYRGRGNNNTSSARGAMRRPERHVNPSGPDGKTLLCAACGSFRHMIANCPDSWENMSKSNNVNVVEDSEENVVLFTGYNNDIQTKLNVAQLTVDARNSAVLDCACSSTVCGQNWMDCYIDSLSDEDKERVLVNEGVKIFKFGGGERLKSKGSYCIPAVLAGKPVTVKTDVVDSDIPLLLSMDAMKRAKVKLDLENDTAVIFGEKIALNSTSSGHYCIPIDKYSETKVESVCAVRLSEMKEQERYKALLKLHRQFGHPSENRLKALLVDAGVWSEQFASDLHKIQSNCEICKMYMRTPSRPIVALPLASQFNEKVCMDLKRWKQSRWILHMIDIFSRFSVSVFIDRKRPRDVIDKVMSCWVATFGVMEAILTDNGGEFSSDEMRDVASVLNVELLTTAAESPFQNGICERNHAVTDTMLIKMAEQCPDTSDDVLLCWANMAKNSLQMNQGFSSYQIVFGKNPNLPNVLSDRVPALQGATASEVLANHLNALHAARRSFVESEADERIRRALRSKIRASEQIYHNGERVYYKRDGSEKWLGPGKVVFQDGKLVYVRHGGVFVRVSPNRLMKAGSEFVHDEDVTATAKDHERNHVVDTGVDESAGEEVVPSENQPNDDNEATDNSNDHAREADSVRSGDVIEYKLEDNDDWEKATILGRAGKATGQYKTWFNVRREKDGEQMSLDLGKGTLWRNLEENDVYVVTVPRERQGEAECIKAKQVELDKLKEFDTYMEVTDVGQKRISTTWVLWWKGEEVRARLVARGFEDEEDIRSDSPTIRKSVMRVVLTIASSKQWKVKTTDIKSAFLQGRKIERDVYIVPPKEADVKDGTLWKLKRCLYGLNDAARHFYQGVVEAMKQLGCKQSSYDPALFYMQKEGKLHGIMACHIDDFLHAGDKQFDDVMGQLRTHFLAGKLEEGHFQYVGFRIEQTHNAIVMDQTDYMRNLEYVEVTMQRASLKNESLTVQELTLLRSMVGKINWAVQGTRPDFAFDMIELSTRFRKGIVSDLLRSVKVIHKLREGPSRVIFPALGPTELWKIVVYSDAAHANLCDGVGSVGAHIVLIVGSHNRCAVVSWHAAKIKRIVRSSLAAEALSLQEGIEDGIYVRHLTETLLLKQYGSIPLYAIVDSKSLFECVHSTKLVDDKRLRLDIGAIRESLEKKEVTSVSWCPGKAQIANCMTKKGAASHDLLAVVQNGIFKNDVWN